MAVYPNLLSARTTSGNGTPQEIKRAKDTYREGSLAVWGTWDGASVQIQDSMDQVTWHDVPSGLFTSNTRKNYQTHFRYVRAVVATAGAATNLNAHYE